MLKLLEEAGRLVGKEKPFAFWELLEKSESASKEIIPESFGKIEAGARVMGSLFLGEGSLVKSGSRIEGNVWVGKNCVIGPNAFLRDGAVIADNCFVGICEVKNSIILEGTKIPHFSYVGDSVLGPNCNLGAGTKIANLRHDGKTIMVKIGAKKVDSKRRKLGALLFDGVKTGVNSTINCGAILEKNAKVLPGEFRK
ncbi:MAG: hypothetical protein NUV67_01825 [archaeon]|nr:hypothetical protein [archaeon]